MADPKRWLNSARASTPMEREVLRAGLEVEPPAEAKDEIWDALAATLGLGHTGVRDLPLVGLPGEAPGDSPSRGSVAHHSTSGRGAVDNPWRKSSDFVRPRCLDAADRLSDSGYSTSEEIRSMADGLNRVMLLGNLGAEPELRFTQGGQAVLNMRLATTESYLDRDKVRKERTDWHNIVVWGKRGEALSKILGKGSSIFVEGSLRTSSYDDREGNKRYKTEVIAQNILLTGRGRGGEEGGGGGGYSGGRGGGGGYSGGGGGGGYSGGGRGGPPRDEAPREEAPSDGYGGGGGGGGGYESDDDIPF